MGLSRVQVSAETVVTSGTSGTATLTGVAAGNLLVAYPTNIGETTIAFVAEDDQPDIWATIISEEGPVTLNSVTIARCLRAAGGTTIVTVTADAATDFNFRVAEFTRTGGGIWSDADSDNFIQTAISTSEFCAETTKIDIAASESVVVCNAVADNPSSTGFGTPTPGSGYSQDTSADSRVYWQWQVFSTALTNERGAFTSGVARKAAACIAGFICSASARCFWGFSYCCGPATIRKLDDTGAEVWRYRSGIWDEYATRIAVDPTNDKVYFTGDLSGDGLGRIDAAAGTLDFTFGDPTMAYSEDALIAVPADDAVYWDDDAYQLDGTSIFSNVGDAAAINAARTGYLYNFGPDLGGSPVIQNDLSTGAAVWSVTSSSLGLIRGVVESGGDLWAFESSNDGVDPVRRYTFAAADGTETGPDDLTTGGLGCSWVAIDGSDNFYLVTNNVPDSAIYYLAKFNSAGAQTWEVSFAGVPAANDLLRVCVNNATGDVFVANGTEVRAYNSAGTLQWTFDHGKLIYGLDCDDDGNVYLIGEESTL